MIKPKWIKNFKLRDKEDIRGGCDVRVILVSELKEDLDELYEKIKWEKINPINKMGYWNALKDIKKRLKIND